MARHVVVPLDGSILSESILPYVLHGLAPERVTLVHVLDQSPPRPPAGTLPLGPAEVGARIERAAAFLRSGGIAEVEILVREGRPADAVLDLLREHRPTLAALTTHGRSGFERLVLGSVAEKVIRASPVPTLVLRPGPEGTSLEETPRLLERVLVPFDGSESAMRALGLLALLDRPRRSKLTMFGVVEMWGEPHTGRPDAAAGRDLVAQFVRLRCESMREACAREAVRASELGFRAEVEVATGHPASKILEWADAIGATLVAMTTHGRSGVARFALGSVTEQVLRESTVPLLVCR